MKVEGQLFPPSRLAFEQFFFWFFYPAWHHEIDSTREKIPSYCPSISVLENTTMATFLEISEPSFLCFSPFCYLLVSIFSRHPPIFYPINIVLNVTSERKSHQLFLNEIVQGLIGKIGYKILSP